MQQTILFFLSLFGIWWKNNALNKITKRVHDIKYKILEAYVCVWQKNIFVSLFYYSDYFCYYSWALLHFLILFMSLTILFQLTFTFISVLSAKNFQFQQNKRITNRPYISLSYNWLINKISWVSLYYFN